MDPLKAAEGEWLPLYEAKTVHHDNHRWATYDGMEVRDVKPEELQDPNFSVLPRYWVHEENVQYSLANSKWNKKWFMGWRDICRATDERTVVGGIIPATGSQIPSPAEDYLDRL